MDKRLHAGAPLSSERRKVERRRNAAESKLLVRLFALRRAFGADTAKRIALRIGIDADKAVRVMQIGGERRIFRGRGFSPIHNPRGHPHRKRDRETPATTLTRSEIEALRSLSQSKSIDRPVRHEYFARLLMQGFVFRSCDGKFQVTHHGRQALLRQSYIDGALQVLEIGRSDLIDSSVREWLEANQFIVGPPELCAVTPHGSTWLDAALNAVEHRGRAN